MENLSQRFDHDNPNASDRDSFSYLKGKADELKLLQARLSKIEGPAKSIHNQLRAANNAIEVGNFEEADDLTRATAEELQQEERTLKEVETQSEIRFARGDAALFNNQPSAAADHYHRAANYFYESISDASPRYWSCPPARFTNTREDDYCQTLSMPLSSRKRPSHSLTCKSKKQIGSLRSIA